MLKLLRSADCALSHEMIEGELTEPVNRSTIYRILNRFEAEGLIHRIVAEDGRQYFASCAHCDAQGHDDNHPHFHCTACQRLECLPQPLDISLPQGYRPVSLNATISGYCAECRPDVKAD